MTDLSALTCALRAYSGVQSKQAILPVSRAFEAMGNCAWLPNCEPILNGDDAAAIPDEHGYLLLAAEGILPRFVQADPWFAGFCSVMVNVNDIAAMGGVPYAVADVLFTGSAVDNQRVLEGLRDASAAFGVPVVGGHTARGDATTWLSVAIVGRARSLLASHQAKPGHDLVCAIDLRGTYRGSFNHFNAATHASGQDLRRAVALLSEIAEAELAEAAKDISQAGLLGTLLMLCESAQVSAHIDLARVPRPHGIDWERWLTTFPSYGFLLACDPSRTSSLLNRFRDACITAERVGHFAVGTRVELEYEGRMDCFWDLSDAPLTGFGSGRKPTEHRSTSDTTQSMLGAEPQSSVNQRTAFGTVRS